jgi:hypothetical protein
VDIASARGELQALGGTPDLEAEAHDAPLHAAPGGGHGVGTVGCADDDQPGDSLRVTLTERQRHHTAVGCTDDGTQRLDAQMIDEASSSSA